MCCGEVVAGGVAVAAAVVGSVKSSGRVWVVVVVVVGAGVDRGVVREGNAE